MSKYLQPLTACFGAICTGTPVVRAVERVLAPVFGAGLFGPSQKHASLRHSLVLKRASRLRYHGFLVLAGVLLAILPLGSCARKQADAASPPPEPRVTRAPRPQPPAGPVSEPQTVASLPSPQPVPPGAIPETPGPLVPLPVPENNAQPEPSPRRPVASAPPAASESVAAPETPAASVPQLGQMLSPDQRQKYNQAIEQAIKRAQDRLDVVVANSARPNEEQAATIKRIRAFIKQAEEARGQDLTIAWNLAERAKLLAEDLAKNFK